ncbi:MAG: hypothetical protein IJV80_02570 [Clostridia bacterium]|nr:hypothetical protein [Clostridia bacterium]
MWNLLAFENLTPLNWTNVLKALTILWQGLLAIFIVIGLIIIAVKLINGAINKIEKAKAEKAAQAEQETKTE